MEKQENTLPGENVWFRYLQKHDVLVGVGNGVESSRVVFPCDVVLGFSVTVGTVYTGVKVLVGFSVNPVVLVGCSVIVVFVGLTVALVVVGRSVAAVGVGLSVALDDVVGCFVAVVGFSVV